MKSIALRTALVAASTLIALLLMEAVARFTFRDLTTTSDGRSYFNRRWFASAVRLNQMGFRERELTSHKERGVYRIAIIGDSFTFGQGLEESQRFSNLLAERLAGRGVEVMNFGESGADTADELRTLQHSVLPFHPDFVVLQWFPNDFEGHTVRPRLPLGENWYGPLHAKLVSASALYSLSNLAIQRLTGASGDYPGYMRTTFGNPDSPASRAATEALRQFAQVCRQAGMDVTFVLMPVLVKPLREAYPLAFLHDRVLQVCTDQHSDCLDLRWALPDAPDPTTWWVTRLDSHAGPEVNRFIAEQLMHRYEAKWTQRAAAAGTPAHEGRRSSFSGFWPRHARGMSDTSAQWDDR